MKQTFFNPALIGLVDSKPGHLPRMVSRRFRGTSRHGAASYKTDAPVGDDPDGKKAELLTQIKKVVAAEMEERGNPKDKIDSVVQFMDSYKNIPLESLREMANEKTGAMATLANLSTRLDEVNAELEKRRNPEDFSTRAQAKKYIETHKDTITQIRSGNRQAFANLQPFELQTRAVASPMLPSTVNPTGNMFVGSFAIDRTIVQDPLPIPTLWDYLRKPNTNAETLVWVNKKPRDGEAAFIAPGVYKPGISFTFDGDTSHSKKVADSAKMATELLQDIDGFADFVDNELRNAVLMKVNEKLTTGVESTTVPAGIRTLAVPYNAALGIHTTNPNFYDAIKAAETQLLSQRRFQSRRVLTFINPIDRANMEMTKATTQGQLFVPFTLRSTLVDDSDIPLGYFQMFVIDAYNIRVYKPLTISWGLENDDFTKNLVTAIGEMRLHQFVKDSDIGFAIYDSYANVINGIKPAA